MQVAGALAVALGLATEEELQACLQDAEQTDSTLSEGLVARGNITSEQVECLERLADELLSLRDGDVGTALAVVRSPAEGNWGRTAFQRTDDAEEALAEWAAFDGSSLAPLDGMTVTDEADGRYVLPPGMAREDIVGQGGMGKVCRVLDRHLGREVAFKELLGAGSRTADVDTGVSARRTVSTRIVGRFLREARVTAQLEHPSIVPLYELGKRKDGRLYYTMKLVRGRTLASEMTERQTLAERLGLLPHFGDLCQAVAYAHSRGVIHRDIKPHNVMIGEFGETVLLDWGLAKVKGRDDVRGEEMEREIQTLSELPKGGTVLGRAIGTPAYMSPEQAAGNLALVDERSDVWSLGAVLYELLTGARPYVGTKLGDILSRAVRGDFPPLKEVGRTLPGELAAVCQRAMSKNRLERYASARELAADVDAYLAGRRVEAHTYTSWELLRRFVAANKATCSFVVVLFAVLLTATVLLSQAYDKAETARQDAVKQRVSAQQSEAEAKENLAVALEREAASLLEARDHLGAGLYAASAMAILPGELAGFGAEPFRDESRSARLAALARLRGMYLRSMADRQADFAGILRGHAHHVFTLAFSPGGKYLLSGSWDGTLRLWNPEAREEVGLMEGHTGYVHSAAFSPDGSMVVSAGGAGDVRVWDVPSGRLRRRLVGHKGDVWTAVFSPDGRFVASAGSDKSVRLWEPATGRQLAMATAHDGYVFTAAFAPDGKTLATGGQDATVRIWSVPDLVETRSLAGHSAPVRAVLFDDQGGLVSAGWDGKVLSWQLTTGESRIVAQHDDRIWSMALSPNGKVLATVSSDNTVKMWRYPEGKLLASLGGRARHAWDVAFSPSGHMLVTGGTDKLIRIWRLREGASPGIDAAGDERPTALAASRSGRMLASGTVNGGIHVWDVVSGRELAASPGHHGAVESLSFAPEESLLSSAGRDNRIRVWRLPDLAEVSEKAGHEGDVYSVAYSPDGKTLISGGRDGQVCLRDPTSARQRSGYVSGMDRVFEVSWSSDGSLLAIAGTGTFIDVREAATWSRVCALEKHEGWVSSAHFSHKGDLLASSGKDGRVLLWDVKNCSLAGELSGPGDWVNRVDFSVDDRFLVSGGDDGQVRVWEVDSGRLCYRFDVGKGVQDVTFLTAGPTVAFPEEGSIRILHLQPVIWEAPPLVLLEQARARAGETVRGFDRKPVDLVHRQ